MIESFVTMLNTFCPLGHPFFFYKLIIHFFLSVVKSLRGKEQNIRAKRIKKERHAKIKKKERCKKMIEQDTIKLLRECDAGIKMGVASIDDVLPYTKGDDLKKLLEKCKEEHEKLKEEVHTLLTEYRDDGKEPNPIAKGMSWFKVKMEMFVSESDKKVADLMTDGCNMGVKSLNRYLNQYEAAEEKVKDITKRLINLEEKLTVDMRDYL